MSHDLFSQMRFPTSAIPQGLGSALTAARSERGWTQARLARAARLKRETVSRLETGRCHPYADTVFRLEAALDLEPGTLVPAWPEWSPIGAASFGSRSRARRRALGLSLLAVAGSARVSVATLSRFEREVERTPSLVRVVERNEFGDIDELVSDDLARALGFADRVEHQRFCLARD